MARTYFPVLLLLGFVVMNAVLMIGVSIFVVRSRMNPVKAAAYESGIPVIGDARERFSVKFYMIAMLFIIFDIETVFLIPWAVHFKQLSCTTELVSGLCAASNTTFYGLGVMLIFMLVLLVGFIYEWKKGALQWD